HGLRVRAGRGPHPQRDARVARLSLLSHPGAAELRQLPPRAPGRAGRGASGNRELDDARGVQRDDGGRRLSLRAGGRPRRRPPRRLFDPRRVAAALPPRDSAGDARHARSDAGGRVVPHAEPDDPRRGAAAPAPRLGPGRHGPPRLRGVVHHVGRRHRDDDAQGAPRSELPEPYRRVGAEAQASGSAGLDRAVGVQPSLRGRRGVRRRPPPGLPQGSADPGRARRHRRHAAAAAAMNAAPLGVFDSGIGGLTVARALFERLPHEAVLYFGDTARVPYGPKSPETVRRYSAEILAYLIGRGVKAVVVACNTSTAHALDHLRSRASVPVVWVIEPGSRAAAAATRSGTIGVIGTSGTVASGAYERAIKAVRPDARVVSQACPLFVPLVEEGWFDHPAAELIAREYLQ